MPRRLLIPLALTIMLAGCGSSSAPSQTPVVIANSPKALATVIAAAAATARTTAEVQMSLSGGAVSGMAGSTGHAQGAFDFLHERGSLVLAPAHSSKQTRAWTLIFLPKVAYSRPPPRSDWKLPRNKPWMSIDLTGSETLSTNMPRFIPQLQSLNPLISLDALRWGARAAATRVRTTVDGMKATQYTVNVDLQSALNREYRTANSVNKSVFVAAVAPQVRPTNGSSPASDKSRIQLQVWVDDKGRVVKLSTPSLVGDGATTIMFRRFGTAISLHPPAAGESVDAASIGPAGERENNQGGDTDGA